MSKRDVTESDEAFVRGLFPERLRLGIWSGERAKLKAAARVAELLAALYVIHPVGGPLHAAVDDGNLDGAVTPYYACYTDADLDELYFEGWPIAELSPMAPAVVEGLGRSLRQICAELAALLNTMTVEEREAAVARHHGHAEEEEP